MHEGAARVAPLSKPSSGSAMLEQHELNRRRWEEITPVHVRSSFYNVEGFLRGERALDQLESDGAGDVRGRSLLHLQCHFGLGALSFARLGAQVTGVDFSESSIAKARELSDRCRLSARTRFLCCEVLELDQHLDERFDVVFTSYGVITWLCDLARWGRIISRFLKPGGRFFMVEIHPVSFMFHEESGKLEIAYDYFNDPGGLVIPPEPDYADRNYVPVHGERFWAWSLADVHSAIAAAGLQITDFREYPFSIYRQFSYLERHEDGFWHMPAGRPQMPLLFSISARRPA
jgi:SAM-dependent methyltransferase